MERERSTRKRPSTTTTTQKKKTDFRYLRIVIGYFLVISQSKTGQRAPIRKKKHKTEKPYNQHPSLECEFFFPKTYRYEINQSIK